MDEEAFCAYYAGGDIDAQFNLGLYYYRGIGVKRNLEKAVQWFEKAAKAGDMKAQYHMGDCCYVGPHTVKFGSSKFTGSFKACAAEKGKLKAYTVNVSGMMVGSVGYGTATLKKPAVSLPVTIE